MIARKLLLLPLLLSLQTVAVLHGQTDRKPVDAETFEYFTKLVQIDTSNPPGQ